MPKSLDDVKPEDLDPQFETIKKVATEQGPAIVGAIAGISTGLATSKFINEYANGQPEEKRQFVRYGLKGVATLIGVGEIAAAMSIRPGGGQTAAVVGGVSFVATEVVEMASDAFAFRGVVFPKDDKSQKPENVQPYQPKQGEVCDPCQGEGNRNVAVVHV